MPSFLRDLKIAVRHLLQSPGFAITAVLMLALGITHFLPSQCERFLSSFPLEYQHIRLASPRHVYSHRQSLSVLRNTDFPGIHNLSADLVRQLY